ncbi:monocarboxylate transporter 7-like isoform X3 [Dermacentor variabilis]|uniref:monocarboxylate transporter 7-like isoform X3 n=1 Tax=Dermacentor variabilis TaxID=34621 RepID=UPI003F5AF147
MVCALRRIKMDSPRSWLVAAACCWINVFSFALVRSAAVVYVSLLQAFPVTRQRASWPVNLSVVCCFLTGPIAGVMARYISIWKLSVVGCLGGSLAVCACSFAPSMLFLDVFLGIVHGTRLPTQARRATAFPNLLSELRLHSCIGVQMEKSSSLCVLLQCNSCRTILA